MEDMIPLDDVPEAEPEPQAPPLEAIIAAQNIAEMLAPEEVARIGEEAVREYEIDAASMKTWKTRMKAGLDLAALVKEEKTYPWANAANIKYPLVTTASLMFNAKAYPAVVPSGQVVHVAVQGRDPNGMKAARGERVSAFMSHQLLNVIEEWEEDTDKLLVLLPIVGTMVRKVWFCPAEQRIRSKILLPGAFVVNDKVTTTSNAPRLSEELPLFPSEIIERVKTGVFMDKEYGTPGEDKHAQEDFIEQHRRMDLDGDGYPEPYVVTVHKDSRHVARIVADFDLEDVTFGQGEPVMDPMTGGLMVDQTTGQPVMSRGPVTSIRRGQYYIAYHFLPSMDGGFFGTGFGLLLGDISETINSIMNMMINAGHAASLGGGFIGSDFRIKGGSQPFRPGEWKLAQSSGGTIRDSIVPMTFPGPDGTLFQMLGLLIEAGKEVASIKDVLTGESGGRNMTATTTLALIEQGMAQFTAAYKRIFRSLKQEFRLVAKINAATVTPEAYNAFHDEPQPLDPRAEFNMADMDISPVADPQSVTRMQTAAKGQLVMQMAEMGLVDRNAASMRILESAAIGNVEELMPQPDPMAAQMAEMAATAAKADLALKMVDIDLKLAQVEKARADALESMADAALKEQQVMRFDIALRNLEAVRNGLGATITGTDDQMGAGPGGMAGQPGNGADPNMLGAPAGFAPGGGPGPVLGGDPFAGGPAAFADPGGAVPGGYV